MEGVEECATSWCVYEWCVCMSGRGLEVSSGIMGDRIDIEHTIVGGGQRVKVGMSLSFQRVGGRWIRGGGRGHFAESGGGGRRWSVYDFVSTLW